MNRRLAWILITGSGALVAALVLLQLAGRSTDEAGREREVIRPSPERAEETASPLRIQLYFAGAGNKLHREARQIEAPGDPKALAQAVVTELLAGPSSERLSASFPPDVTLGTLDLAPDGVVWVDLHSQEHAAPPTTGSTAERLALHSLVYSLVENVPGAESVVLLWNGRQPLTFGGHIDTSRPLEPARDLLSS